MKRVLLGVAVLGLVLIPFSVISAEEEAQQQDTQTQSVKAEEQRAAELKKRIEERKARLKTRLDAAATKKTADRCKGSQQKLEMFSGKVDKTNKNFLSKYEAYIQKIEQLEKDLSEQGVKSSELLNLISELKTKYEALSVATAALEASVNDAKQINCAADPAGFKAALEDARAYAKTVHDSRVELVKLGKTSMVGVLNKLKLEQS